MTTSTAEPVPMPDAEPTLDVMRAARYLGIGRTKAYELLAEDDFPVEVLRFGRVYRVRTTDLRRYLGLD